MCPGLGGAGAPPRRFLEPVGTAASTSVVVGECATGPVDR